MNMKRIGLAMTVLICVCATNVYAEDDAALLRAAHAGDADAMRRIGIRMHKRLCSRGNPTKGLQWLEKAVEQGDTDAMYYLGQVYASKKNYAKAARYLKQAAEGGHHKAEESLGKLPLKYSREIVEEKAEAGDYKACMRLLGAYVLGGKGVEVDSGEAWKCFEKAYDINEKSTMETLRGWEISRTAPIWEKLVTKQESENEEILVALAELYEKGGGNISADEEKAKKYYSDAATLGNLRAQGWLKERGLPCESREEKKERLAREEKERQERIAREERERRERADREERERRQAAEREAEGTRKVFRLILGRAHVSSAKFLACREGLTLDVELSLSEINAMLDFSDFFLQGRVMQRIGDRQFLANANGEPISVDVPPGDDVNFADGDMVHGIFLRNGDYQYKTVSGQWRTVRNYILILGSN